VRKTERLNPTDNAPFPATRRQTCRSSVDRDAPAASTLPPFMWHPAHFAANVSTAAAQAGAATAQLSAAATATLAAMFNTPLVLEAGGDAVVFAYALLLGCGDC